MSIHQLKDGRWFVQYRVKDKIKREYFGRGITAEREARERDSSLAITRHLGNTKPDSSPTFLEIAEGYLAGRMASMESTTYDVLMYKLKAFILPELGETETMKITKDRIDKYVLKRLAQGKQNATIHREITDIQAILNWAVNRVLISRNPLSGYKKPRPDPEIISPPTLKEMAEIDKYAPPHLQRALKIIFYTGARPGREILGLKWSNVNFNQNTIRIISAKKHGLKFRDIPLYKDFRRDLKIWHKEDGKQDDLNIINYKRKGVKQGIKSLQTSWGRAKELAGITRAIRPYSYRHAFVSMLLDSGADLKSVSEIVGHSSVNLTLAVYAHTNKAMHRAAINKLPAISW